MAASRIVFGLLLLIVGAVIEYASVRDGAFSVIDQIVAAICLVSGLLLLFQGWRAGREHHQHRRRRRRSF
jgi:hypothetical protein